MVSLHNSKKSPWFGAQIGHQFLRPTADLPKSAPKMRLLRWAPPLMRRYYSTSPLQQVLSWWKPKGKCDLSQALATAYILFCWLLVHTAEAWTVFCAVILMALKNTYEVWGRIYFFATFRKPWAVARSFIALSLLHSPEVQSALDEQIIGHAAGKAMQLAEWRPRGSKCATRICFPGGNSFGAHCPGACVHRGCKGDWMGILKWHPQTDTWNTWRLEQRCSDKSFIFIATISRLCGWKGEPSSPQVSKDCLKIVNRWGGFKGSKVSRNQY